jgi:hypothetical protein
MSWGAQNRSEDAKTPSTPRGRSKKPEPGCCPIQPYSKTAKKRAKETTTEQGTPQDKGRLKITPTIQENQDKEQHRRTTTNHRKAIPKEHEWGYQEEFIEGHDGDGHVVLIKLLQ